MKQRHTSVSLRYNHLWLLWFSCILSFAVAVAASDITHQPSTLHWSAASSVPSDDGLAVEDDSEDKHTNNNNRLFSLLRKIERVSSSSHYRRSKIGRRHSSRYHGWVIVTRGGSSVGAEAEIEEAILPTNSSDVTNSSDLSSVETAPLSSLSSEWIDTHARSIALTMAWVVTAQTVSTVLHSFRDEVVEFASRFVKQDTLAAARSIRQMLETMDDHGIVDLLAHHEKSQILVSIYALYKLQAACQFHERSMDAAYSSERMDLELLQDLYDCIPFATAAYGWKFNLATSGKWHKGDRQALVKMTHVDPSDIVTVNWEARPNRPAFYIVRDRKQKRIVLAIRGTWSAHDVLTDLCCTTEDYHTASNGRGKRLRAHSGMLTAARGVALLAEDVIAQELEEHPDYSLLLVGHSLGGSAAAVLGTLWAQTFRHVDVNVYAYGPACVFPESFHDDYKGANIVSVLLDGDPFSCLSLGHVADVSGALDYLCEDRDMRRVIIVRTDEKLHDLNASDLEWCSRTMADIKRSLVLADKLYPPGKLLFIHKKSKHSKQPDCSVQEVTPSFFHFWKLGPRMFDLTRHAPKAYESSLRKSIIKAKQQ